MNEKTRKKALSILSVLKSSDKPLSSSEICEELKALGHEISERTVRLYLRKMDEDGLTDNTGKRGRQITEQGLHELDSSKTVERVGFFSAKIDRMTYGMDFDLTTKSGTVVINMTLVSPTELAKRA
ncbi:MAG: DUF128 domain-containing protein, partial [Chloroflexi bacterium]|nr:DUF128 domain-containing protein [Chloroflexota bacterium]